MFDNGDENKIAASKTFINFMANSDETAKAVKTSTYFSVKNSLSDLYKDDEVMNEYQKLMPYLGDYYQVTPGWAEARTAWWNMLQPPLPSSATPPTQRPAHPEPPEKTSGL